MKKLLIVCLALGCSSLYGATSLEEAVKGGNFEEVKAAVGGNLNARDTNDNRFTPLMYAAKLGKKDLVEALIAAGADVNAGGVFSVLSLAVDAENKDIVHALIAAGANVNAKNRSGISILMNAILKGNKDIVHALITAGADVTAKDNNGDSVFRRAIDRGNKEIVQMLIDTKKVNLEERSRGKMAHTPLMLAVTSDKSNYPVEKIVEILINAGADVNAKYGYRTVVDLAKNDEIKAILKKAGGKSGKK
jgi:ankyrin repeat protein